MLVANAELVRLFARKIVDLVAVAIDDDRAFGPANQRAPITSIASQRIAAEPFPGDRLVRILLVDFEGVVVLPVVLEGIAAASGGDAAR